MMKKHIIQGLAYEVGIVNGKVTLKPTANMSFKKDSVIHVFAKFDIETGEFDCYNSQAVWNDHTPVPIDGYVWIGTFANAALDECIVSN